MTQDEKDRIEEFARVAELYVAFIETAPHSSDEDLITCRKLLCRLHIAAVDLPYIELPDDENSESEEDPDPKEPLLESYNRAMHRLGDLRIDTYWEVFNPFKREDAIAGSLRDDLSDIYQDLLKGLRFEKLGELERFCFEWRMAFDFHWGHHLIDAQRAIHSYLSGLD